MAGFYPYLVASLPMLYFPMKPPFSFERFLDICCPLIPEKDCQVLRTLPKPEQYPQKVTGPRVIQRWVEFDCALRNELVKVRAMKRHLDPAAYLRDGGFCGSLSPPAVSAAGITASLMDGEKELDEMRWKKLEDLASGHYFDLDFLVTYACKLLILERWEAIRNADGTVLLERALEH